MQINNLEIKLQLQDEEWPFEYIDHDREIVRAIVFDDQGYFYFVRAERDDDFGKAICTEKINGAIHAYNHENAGLPLIKAFLARLTKEKDLTSYVLNLDALHMKPNTMQSHGSSVKSTNKMFDEAREPCDLLLLAVSDNRGRLSEHPFVDTEPFLRERLAVYEEYMSRPFVGGKDLVAAGLTPTEDFSQILAYAHKLRLAGIPKDSALKQTLSFAKNLR